MSNCAIEGFLSHIVASQTSHGVVTHPALAMIRCQPAVNVPSSFNPSVSGCNSQATSPTTHHPHTSISAAASMSSNMLSGRISQETETLLDIASNRITHKSSQQTGPLAAAARTTRSTPPPHTGNNEVPGSPHDFLHAITTLSSSPPQPLSPPHPALSTCSHGSSPTLGSSPTGTSSLGSSPPFPPAFTEFMLDHYSKQLNQANTTSLRNQRPSLPSKTMDHVIVSSDTDITQASSQLLSIMYHPHSQYCLLFPQFTSRSAPNDLLTLSLYILTLACHTQQASTPNITLGLIPIVAPENIDDLSMIVCKVDTHVLSYEMGAAVHVGNVSPDAIKLEASTNSLYQMKAGSVIFQKFLSTQSIVEVIFSVSAVKTALQALAIARNQLSAAGKDSLVLVDMLQADSFPGFPSNTHVFHCKFIALSERLPPLIDDSNIPSPANTINHDPADTIAVAHLLSHCHPASLSDPSASLHLNLGLSSSLVNPNPGLSSALDPVLVSAHQLHGHAVYGLQGMAMQNHNAHSMKPVLRSVQSMPSGVGAGGSLGVMQNNSGAGLGGGLSRLSGGYGSMGSFSSIGGIPVFGGAQVLGASPPAGAFSIPSSSPRCNPPPQSGTRPRGRKADHVIVTEDTAVKNAAGAIAKVLGRIRGGAQTCPVYTEKKTDTYIAVISVAVKAITVASGYVTNEGTGHEVGFQPYIRCPDLKSALGSSVSGSGMMQTPDMQMMANFSNHFLLDPETAFDVDASEAKMAETEVAFDVFKVPRNHLLYEEIDAQCNLIQYAGPGGFSYREAGMTGNVPVKVTAHSRPSVVSNIITKLVCERNAAVLITAGGKAMHVAMCAVLAARKKLRARGADILLLPKFVTVDTTQSLGWESVFIRFVIVPWHTFTPV